MEGEGEEAGVQAVQVVPAMVELAVTEAFPAMVELAVTEAFPAMAATPRLTAWALDITAAIPPA